MCLEPLLVSCVGSYKSCNCRSSTCCDGGAGASVVLVVVVPVVLVLALVLVLVLVVMGW